MVSCLTGDADFFTSTSFPLPFHIHPSLLSSFDLFSNLFYFFLISIVLIMDLSRLNQDDISRLETLLTFARECSASTSPSTASNSASGRINPDDLNRLHSLSNRLQPPNGNPPLSQPASIISSRDTGPRPPTSTPSHTLPSTLTDNIPISPYHSIRATQQLPSAPQGHPSTSTLAAAPLPNHFLGLSSLGSNIRGHVNQQRLASSARNQLPTEGRRRRRGPAKHPPSIRTPVPKIEDCLSTLQDADGLPLIRIKVKVYPPQV
jgi:hypothetical protein